MKTPHFIPIAAFALLAATGCDKKSNDVSAKLAELERKNDEATSRQRELERELEDQKLAAERDAIERERAKIDADRDALEREQGDAAAAQEEAIRKREEDLAAREGRLDKFQYALDQKQDEVAEKSANLSAKERDMAGREALPFQPVVQSAPVADYGTFYDTLGAYGSWFETDDYGYVWQPVAVRDSNWRPYSRGRWACSDRGWTWISDEPFGWATYHYGRWALLRGRGWIWVPGTEWAPSWVSWRENDNCIGWAPLPPETLAYRGQAWDSTVDVQFGIGAAWFSFVEIRNFGSPVYDHCLPISTNYGYYQQTTNITYIHIDNREVICGGPRYQRVCDRIGKPVPFYRIDREKTYSGRESREMRPRVIGDRLVVNAPNMDAKWNDGLRPKQIRGRLDTVSVERDRQLSGEISNHFRQSRQEGRERAEESIAGLGGVAKFQQGRREQLQESRLKANPKSAREEIREVAVDRDRPQGEVVGNREDRRDDRPDGKSDGNDRTGANDRTGGNGQTAGNQGRQPNGNRNNPQVPDRGNGNTRPMAPHPGTLARDPRQPDRVMPDENGDRQNDNDGGRQQDDNDREQQRQTDQQGDKQQDAKRRQDEQQRQQQTEKQQRDADQARETRKQQDQQRTRQDDSDKRQRQGNDNDRQQENDKRQQDAEKQKDMQRQRQQEENQRQQQQENQRQRQQEQAQRQQEAEKQKEAQRQQQQENQRQRQQEENQRQQQQENQRQRQQEENQRQQQQEQQRQRQQEESQRQKKDDDDRRGKNR